MDYKYRDFTYSLVFALAATSFSYILGLQMHWITTLSWVEALAVFTSFSCTWLCVTQSTLNYPMGIVSSVAYGFLFLSVGLVSSAVSSFYLVPILFIGWNYWKNGWGKPEIPSAVAPVKDPVKVTHITWSKNTLFYIISGLITWALLWAVTNKIGATMPMYDSAILILSIFAQYFLQGKKLENWYIWIFMNVICIYTYFTTGLFIVGVQYIFFIATDIVGLIQWRKTMKEDAAITASVKLDYDLGLKA